MRSCGAGAALWFLWWPSDDTAPSALTVRYRTGAPATGAVARPWLEVVNTSDKAVDLSDVTLRYYYSADDGSVYASNCVQTSLGCSHVTQKTVTAHDAVPHADHYLEVGFRQATGTLAPGGSTKGIGLQLYRVDHGRLDQDNDHSFDMRRHHVHAVQARDRLPRRRTRLGRGTERRDPGAGRLCRARAGCGGRGARTTRTTQGRPLRRLRLQRSRRSGARGPRLGGTHR